MAFTLADARALDAADPLSSFRARFLLPEGLIYLDGNSLGALPAGTSAAIAECIGRQWGERLIRSWNEAGWAEAPARIGDRIARLVGAAPGEIVACDTTSINLFKLVVAAAGLRPGAILAEADNFPTDAYVAAEAAHLLGRKFRMVDGADIAAAIEGDVAVVVVTHVNYRTGARADMSGLNAAARAVDARIVWDLSHSAGAVPLDLARDGTELAIGCGYKYLCGGPGAPAFLHVASTLQPRLRSPIAGWWGHSEPFAFSRDYSAAPGVARFLAGTPPVIGLAGLETGVAAVADADPAMVWAKAVTLWQLFVDRLAAVAPDLVPVTPGDPSRRGSQVCLRHPEAHAIVQAAIARGVIGDFRAPDIARFGFAPLYLSHEEVWHAADAIGLVMKGREWDDPRHRHRADIT